MFAATERPLQNVSGTASSRPGSARRVLRGRRRRPGPGSAFHGAACGSPGRAPGSPARTRGKRRGTARRNCARWRGWRCAGPPPVAPGEPGRGRSCTARRRRGRRTVASRARRIERLGRSWWGSWLPGAARRCAAASRGQECCKRVYPQCVRRGRLCIALYGRLRGPARCARKARRRRGWPGSGGRRGPGSAAARWPGRGRCHRCRDCASFPPGRRA